MSTTDPSGAQVDLRFGDQTVTITEVGANIRAYSVAGRPVFVPFARDEVAPVFNGAVLLPWPNRLRDGRYDVDGVTYQVPITEPARGTALHGLASWHRWPIVTVDAARAVLELHLPPSPGYPFDLVSRVTYALADDGLTVQATTTNVGPRPAPYGIGFHPWLSPGDAPLDECTLQLDAATRVTTDERLLPTGTEPAAGGFDLRAPRPLTDADLDDAYVDVVRDDVGRSWARLAAPDGHTAAVWLDESMDVWQVCTGNHIEPAALRRTGVAAEPMSCVADALRTGDRLVRLAPGGTHTVRWGACLF